MGSEFKSIPVIDIRGFLVKCNDPDMIKDEGVCQVVKQLDKACKDVGFFYVTGHGIPDSLVKEVRDLARNFFSLPDEEKLKIKMTAKTGLRGYRTVGETVTKGKPDMNEAINCYREVKPGLYGTLGEAVEGSNKWPENPSNFKSVMEEYISLLTDLSRNILKGITLALGGTPDEFGNEKIGDPFWSMRLIGYPGVSDCTTLKIPENGVGCAAHTDYCLLTLVNQDDEVSGLQVRNCFGEWIRAEPIPGTFICNIGEVLKIWSNGLYESPIHQVINNSPKYRVSVPFFYQPNFDAVVKPLEFCKQKTGGMDKFEEAVYGAYFLNKIINIMK